MKDQNLVAQWLLPKDKGTPVELITQLVTLLAVFAFNVVLAFMGLVVGEYRISKKRGDTSTFKSVYKDERAKLLYDLRSGDGSPIVWTFISGIFGLFFFIFTLPPFPVGKDNGEN